MMFFVRRLDSHLATRRACLLVWLWATLLATGCQPTVTSEYPNRPIKLIVPFSPGGGTDTYARIMKKAIEDHQLLPQPLVIINLDGAGGTIGSRRLKNAKSDGYSIMILHEAIVTAQYSGQAPYGPEAFAPIAGTIQLGLVVAVREDSPYMNLQELLEAARQGPDELVFAANLGAPVHFVGLRMEQQYPGAKFRFTQTGGGTKRLHAVKGGHADLTAFSIEEYLRYESAGIRALAYCDEERHPALPDVLTTHEQGIPVTHINMQFWWAPKGTPQNRIDLIANALEKAMQTTLVQQRIAEVHGKAVFVRGEAMQDEIDARREALRSVDLRKSIELPNLPWIIAITTMILGIAIVVTSSRNHQHSERAIDYPLRIDLAWQVAILTVMYMSALTLELLGFRLATLIFVLVTGWRLTKGAWRQLPLVCLMAISMSWGLHAAFTRLFDLVLP